MEKIPTPPTIETEAEREAQADKELQILLEDPQYSFLNEIAKNRQLIENAESAQEALKIAKQRIDERLERSFLVKFPQIEGVEDEEKIHFSLKGIKRTFAEMMAHAAPIGEGEDAFVRVVTTEMEQGGSYNVCYKFAKNTIGKRGRNTMEQELDLHAEFFTLMKSSSLRVGVPNPFYYSMYNQHNVIAMEKLQARSIDDLRRGLGSVPAWVTEAHVDEFCEQLRQAIGLCHEHNLYHRDLHLGNIMFTQSPAEVDKLGYIIDFGLSGHGHEGMEPYRKESLGQVFTYDDDYGKIKGVEYELKRLVKQG